VRPANDFFVVRAMLGPPPDRVARGEGHGLHGG
jgi:hypothetical protein